jgi:hypothetical protein
LKQVRKNTAVIPFCKVLFPIHTLHMCSRL